MSVSFFFAMAWKSMLISGVALLLVMLLKSRAAAERAALLRVVICLLLALPFAAMLLPAIPLTAARDVPALLVPAAATPVTGMPTIWDDPSELVLLLYLGGMAMVAGRLLAGLWTLRRWTADAQPVLSSEWTEAMARARGDRAADPRLLVSPHPDSPLSWGWRRPVILIDSDSYHMPEEADAILAHEMAHVTRGDWLTLVLARTAVALFWFNPLVWAIERMVMEDAEQAADREAISRIDPARYAQTLLTFAALGKGNPLPANSIASGSLARRVQAILDGGATAAPRISIGTLAAMGASVAIAAPIGALQLVSPGAAQQVHETVLAMADPAPAPVAAPAALANVAPVSDLPEPPAAPTAPAVVALAASAAAGTMAVPPTPPTPPSPPAAPMPPAPPRAPAAPMPMAMVIPAAVSWHGPNPDVQVNLRINTREIERAARLAGRDAERAARDAAKAFGKTQQQAMRKFALAMKQQGAAGMEQGAVSMENGARTMESEAAKLRDKSYRDREIAKAAARGEQITHDRLLEIADQLADKAEEMRDGAVDMREQAREMRSECLDEMSEEEVS